MNRNEKQIRLYWVQDAHECNKSTGEGILSRLVKVSALLTIGLAILFFLFFEICKIAILLGIFMGIALLLSDLSGEGGPPQFDRLAMVAAIFIGMEFGRVLLGYALLAKPTGLFRP